MHCTALYVTVEDIFTCTEAFKEHLYLLIWYVCLFLYPVCLSCIDPPRFDPKELEIFSTPIVIKSGQRPQFKIPYFGREPVKIQWYHEGEELKSDINLKIDTEEGYTRLMFNSKMLRKDTGEIKIKIKNEFGTIEACTKLIVLGEYHLRVTLLTRTRPQNKT